MNIIEEIKKAIISGLLISIGGTVYLGASVKGISWVGAFFFATGLFTICEYGFNLYTGKVGYIGYKFKDKKYIAFVLMVLCVNLLTTFLTGLLIGHYFDEIRGQAYAIYTAKFDNSFSKDFVSSFFCGILMFIAVDTWKRGKILGVFLCVPVFILSGFDHCVANSFYNGCCFGEQTFTLQNALMTIIFSVGNGIGGIFLPVMTRKWKS